MAETATGGTLSALVVDQIGIYHVVILLTMTINQNGR